MSDNKVTCFLPCRQGSQRVPRKNLKQFVSYKYGLIEVKLKQLLASQYIDKIVLSTNDEEIIRYADSLASHRIIVHRRKESLASSATSTDELIDHVHELIPSGHILWTHVTSPFITEKHYTSIIEAYFTRLNEGYDSLMTVTGHQQFLWKNGSPINYDRSVEKWPRTQTIEVVYEVNSGAFIAPSSCYAQNKDRIGVAPFLYELDKLVGFDIDWEEDFKIAEAMIKTGVSAV